MDRRLNGMRAALVISAVALISCKRVPEQHSTSLPPAASGSEASGAPRASAPATLKKWKGSVDALHMKVAILWFAPAAPLTSDRVATEAKQVLDENMEWIGGQPVVDAVIVKATRHAESGPLFANSTSSFVYAPNHEGKWEYTERYDSDFARLRL